MIVSDGSKFQSGIGCDVADCSNVIVFPAFTGEDDLFRAVEKARCAGWCVGGLNKFTDRFLVVCPKCSRDVVENNIGSLVGLREEMVEVDDETLRYREGVPYAPFGR